MLIFPRFNYNQDLVLLIDPRFHICLNPIAEWVQLTIKNYLKYEMSFVEINVF